MRRTAVLPVFAILLLMAGCFEREPDAEPIDNTGPVQARALLWSSQFPHLEIRPYHADGYEPSALALEGLRQTAVDVTGKSRVTVKPPALLSGHTPDRDRRWTADDLRAFHEQTFGMAQQPLGEGDTAIIAAFYLDGRYVDGSGSGVQAGHELYTFMDNYGGNQRIPFPFADRYERAVTIHEFGHALGLVNCGIPMVADHEDPESRCHSTNEDSVMSSLAHLEPTLDQLDEGKHATYTFDENDLKDLQAFRARDPGRPQS